MMKLVFLSLSFLSSMVELGPVIMLAADSNSLTKVLAAGLAYQIGNLVIGVIQIRVLWIVVIGILAACLSLFASSDTALLYLSILMISISLQGLRRFLASSKGDSIRVSTLLKRITRIAGFAVAGFLDPVNYPWLVGLIGLAGIILLFWLRDSETDTNFHAKRNFTVNPLSIVMIIHQSHYFSYAYLMPVLFLTVLQIPQKLVGIGFIIGWVSYASTESLIRKRNFIAIFVIGHFVVAVSLLVLGALYWISWMVFLAWFISGLGGGTVYCLTRLNKFTGLNSVEMEPWEDIGHVTGVIISITLAWLFVDLAIHFWASSTLALLTIISMLISIRWVHRVSTYPRTNKIRRK